MEAEQEIKTVSELIELQKNKMLAANPEYQRGAVWSSVHQKKLIDSLMRGYPLPIIYLHHIKKGVGNYSRDDLEIIDGQQRINALYNFSEGAFSLFDPVADEQKARFPAFIKDQPCEWAGKTFDQLSPELKDKFLSTELTVAMIETDQINEVRDLFVRLQSGLPLNNQETRDAWPGEFTEFILKLGGKPDLARYPGHRFFKDILKMKPRTDRGKTRQLSAQLSMLFLNKYRQGSDHFCSINAPAINDFYYANLDFSREDNGALRLHSVLDKIVDIVDPSKLPKLRAHDAIHIMLLVDSLMDDYAPSWEDKFQGALEKFAANFAEAKATKDEVEQNEFWSQYGQRTRVSSDTAETIEKRHNFYTRKIFEYMMPLDKKDPKRLFGEVERTILFYRQNKKCAVCDSSLKLSDCEIHHVVEHSQAGPTELGNGAAVHKSCHPKGVVKTAEFAAKFKSQAAITEA